MMLNDYEKAVIITIIGCLLVVFVNVWIDAKKIEQSETKVGVVSLVIPRVEHGTYMKYNDFLLEDRTILSFGEHPRRSPKNVTIGDTITYKADYIVAVNKK